MIFINKYKNSKYFIHKINFDILNELVYEKKLGFLDDNNQFLDNINANDFIILCTDLNNKSTFFAYTNVGAVSSTKKELYGCYKSKKILNLKGIKFFKYPLVNQDYSIDDFDYLEISKKEFGLIKPDKNDLSKDFPLYLKKIKKITINTFIKNVNLFLDKLLKEFSENDFTQKDELLKEMLLRYGINRGDKSYFNIDENSNCFIQYINSEKLPILNEKQFVDENDNKSEDILLLKPDDYVLLFSKVNDEFSFFGLGQVRYNLFNNYAKHLKYFKPPNTIKFNKIYRFSRLLGASCILDDKSNLSESYLRKINDNEIDIIEDNFYYLEEYPIENMGDFIIKSCEILLYVIKEISDRELIEIKKFLRYLNIFLESMGIEFSLKEIEQYFSKNAYELNFKYSPSRNPELLMDIRHRKSKIKQFSHIRIN